MPGPERENRQYLLHLWRPAIAFCALLGVAMVAAAITGEIAQTILLLVVIASATLMFFSIGWYRKWQIAQMLRTADPTPVLRSQAASMQSIPHGRQLAAANWATVLALYGRFEEAERALESTPWDGVPPLIEAQRSAARAIVAYTKGSVIEGLDCAIAATHQASLDASVPGAKTCELAFRAYRNLGLALAGRATETTAAELRAARLKLPLIGRILAAWGLAEIARHNGNVEERREMHAFIENHAPHFKPVLANTAG